MSQPSRAILIFYKVNGIDFEDVKVDLSQHHQLSPQFRVINPLMKVPAVVDGRFKLFERHRFCAMAEERQVIGFHTGDAWKGNSRMQKTPKNCLQLLFHGDGLGMIQVTLGLCSCLWRHYPNFDLEDEVYFNGRGEVITGRGKTFDMRNDRERTTGCGGGSGSGKDKIDSLSRLLTRILRHMASELNLNMRSDGYVKVNDLLKLNLKTFANIPLRSHTIDHIREAVRKDNKQRFSLLEENGELLIRANQGHTVKVVETESLLKPILSAKEFPVCLHGTYRKNLESILGSGLKRMKRLHVHFSCGLPTDGEVISGILRILRRASPGAAVKLCLGDLLVMGSNPETASLHMQGYEAGCQCSDLSGR
ncbi:hypothetical protein JHK85_048720 [Glycine max]|nr:hypothetical protein JHK86_048097 [Glycine max]KAG4944074.1 hypothetical protein JHK85_048720 [Glycine max]